MRIDRRPANTSFYSLANLRAILYHKVVDYAQFGICELTIDEDKNYRICVSDFYGHIDSSVTLTREELLDVIYAVSNHIRKSESRKYTKMQVDVERIRVSLMLSLQIAKEKHWSLRLLFYNDQALKDFLVELEKMAVFDEPIMTE